MAKLPQTKYAAKQTALKTIAAARRRERAAWATVNQTERVICIACGFGHLDQTAPEYAAWTKAAQDLDAVVFAAVLDGALPPEKACADYGWDRVVLDARIAAARLLASR